jgi:hypothetical protein
MSKLVWGVTTIAPNSKQLHISAIWYDPGINNVTLYGDIDNVINPKVYEFQVLGYFLAKVNEFSDWYRRGVLRTARLVLTISDEQSGSVMGVLFLITHLVPYLYLFLCRCGKYCNPKELKCSGKWYNGCHPWVTLVLLVWCPWFVVMMTCCEYQRQKKMEKLMPNWPHPNTHQEAIKEESRTQEYGKEDKENSKKGKKDVESLEEVKSPAKVIERVQSNSSQGSSELDHGKFNSKGEIEPRTAPKDDRTMGLGSLDDSMDARNLKKMNRSREARGGKVIPPPEHADKGRLDSGSQQQKGQSKKSGHKTPGRVIGGGESNSP